jgi:hypothetical protein
VVHDVAQELRPGDAPASARGIAVQLPQALARREQQAHATRSHLRSLRHDILLQRVVASEPPKLRFRARADKYSASFDVATISGTIYDLSLIASLRCTRRDSVATHHAEGKIS